ncbi:hypothetical protein BC940DRAFT_306528 [Gongronella butleri]|nr:hypothetical protein BC940DRAFT_306528 [Gongronella butleri]
MLVVTSVNACCSLFVSVESAVLSLFGACAPAPPVDGEAVAAPALLVPVVPVLAGAGSSAISCEIRPLTC